MVGIVEGININILQQCRQQSGYSLQEVKKKISKIEEIENGSKEPTFNQIEILSKLYNVPRWVFISKELPDEYKFEESVPAFRQFSNSNPELFEDSKIRILTAKIDKYRNLIIDILNDLDEDIPEFNPPRISISSNPEEASKKVRTWLGVGENNLSFQEWKEVLEDNGIFIFLTSKYKSWSNIDRMRLRGLSIFHDELPVIIINNSDAKKAQSFTLFHELGHIIRKESSIDDWLIPDSSEEKWCDEFAGNLLMPKENFIFSPSEINDLKDVSDIANEFKVSAYACLVRLRALTIINQSTYIELEDNLIREYQEMQDLLKSRPGGPPRDRANEIIQQFGKIYTRSLFQAYYSNEIGLNKLTKLLDLKKTSHVFEVESKL